MPTVAHTVACLLLAVLHAGSASARTLDTVVVTNRNDAGPGSLREALSRGDRTVRFGDGVDGDIVLTRDIRVRGSFVTLDGAAGAQGKGITLRGFGIRVRGSDGAHDVTIRNVRIRDAAEDGIQVAAGAYNIDIDHVSISGCHDGNVDVTQAGTRDVVIRSSILGGRPDKGRNMLLGNQATGIRLLGNIVIDAPQRNPELSFDQTAAARRDAGTTLDMRNNVVWRWRRGRGTRIEEGATANVIDNYFGGPPGTDLADALIVCTGPATARACSNRPTNVARAYASGNVVHGSAVDLDARGTEAKPFPAPTTPTLGACAAAARAVEDAGARPRDAVDAAYAAAIAACSAQPPACCD
jgi:hypothetical protein